MKKIVSYLHRLFHVEYRLSILYAGETTPRHIHGTSGRQLRNFARTSKNAIDYWSLYKTGPFGLPEREVDFG